MKLVLCLALVCPGPFGWTLVSKNIRGWKAQPLTLYVNPTNCPFAESQLNDFIDRAIDVWNRTPTSGLRLMRAAETISTTADQFRQGSASLVPAILCDTAFSSG